MLYTRTGDAGNTRSFGSKSGERISKSSCQTEALGALDELNSFVGLVKVKAGDVSWKVNTLGGATKTLSEITHWVQECVFIVQAEVAGADKLVGQDKVAMIESIVDQAEKEMLPIKTFFISGGTELATLFDVSRTLTRKAERRVIVGVEGGEFKVGAETLAFLNRLSSLFYALARLTNHKSGITEQSPTYE